MFPPSSTSDEEFARRLQEEEWESALPAQDTYTMPFLGGGLLPMRPDQAARMVMVCLMR